MTPSQTGDEPDHALITRVQSGDASAFEPLIDRHLPHIRAFVALRAPVLHLVDEIAHEAFVFAFQNIADFNAADPFRAWLRAIAWNLLRAEIQRCVREQANQSRYAETLAVEMQRSGESAGASLEAEFLEQCIREVPAEFQRLLTLKYREGRTSEEIAGTLARSVEWVRVVLFRIRRQLRECIENKLEKARTC